MEAISTLARIREVRHEISKEFDHDPKRLIEHYIELQQQHHDRLVASSARQSMLRGKEA